MTVLAPLNLPKGETLDARFSSFSSLFPSFGGVRGGLYLNII